MQSKLGSFIEANVNTLIGFVGSMVIWEVLVRPLWNLPTSLFDNFIITLVFTIWSIARGYGVRRYFNRYHQERRVPRLVARTPIPLDDPVLVGIAGKAGAGKDTLAKFLGYPTDSFAAPIKAMLAAAGLPEPATREAKEAVMPDLGFSWRQAAQRLGTEWGRELNKDIWVMLLLRRVRASGHQVVAIPDVRFENEAALIRMKGVLCHMEERETTVHGAAAAHSSEEGVGKLGGDYMILNGGSLADLKASAKTFKNNYINELQRTNETSQT